MKFILLLLLFSACAKTPKDLEKINLNKVSSKEDIKLQNETKINLSLIEDIIKIDTFALGYHPSMHTDSFFIMSNNNNENSLDNFFGEPSPIIKKIVARGLIIVPDLLKHISDKRNTKLIFKVNNSGFGETSYCEEYEYRDRLKKHEILNGAVSANEDTYNLTVGDFCFFALGQIVNRNYWPLRGQLTGCNVINSPVINSNLRNKIIDDWTDLTEEEHKKLLIDDLGRSEVHKKIATLERILYYYPLLAEKIYYKK